MNNAPDALGAFTFLSDNIPSWITSSNELNAQIAAKQQEYERRPTTKQKHSSNGSIRPGGGEEQNPFEMEVLQISSVNPTLDNTNHTLPPTPKPETPGNTTSKQMFANARRKRKSATKSVMSGASGPQKYRMKEMVVVYYDSTVQEAFEALVRNIGVARNCLRKGKMAAMMKAGLTLPSLRSFGGADRGHASTADYKSTRPQAPSNLSGKAPPFRTARTAPQTENRGSPFDSCDKELETAQSLCEIAAHQFLRDGDCSAEILRAKECFDKALEIAVAEVARLQEEADKEKAEAEQQEQEKRDEDESMLQQQREVVSMLTSQDKADDVTTVNEIKHTAPAMIEIDDGSDESEPEIDLMAFRSARQRARV